MAAIGTLAWASFADSTTTIQYTGKASQTPQIQKLVPSDKPTPRAIKQAISLYSEEYGYDAKILTQLASCESNFRSICIVDSNGKLSCGIFQFQKSTLEQYCPDLKWNSTVNEDIMCAGRMIKEGGSDTLRAHWTTCSKQILK